MAAASENDPFEVACQRLDELTDRLLVETGATEYKAFLTGEGNFRKKIFPEYKANRTQPKPIHLQALRDYAVSKWNAEVLEGYEADDALAWNQIYNGLSKIKTPGKVYTTIVSLDKDLLQVPGIHYSWEIRGTNKGKEWVRPAEWRTISEIEGWRNFYTQCLKGDPTDGIKGIEGIGEKKAAKLLESCETEQDMFRVVREAYGNDEEFLMNAQCLYILRSKEDNWLFHFERLKNG